VEQLQANKEGSKDEDYNQNNYIAH